MENKEPVVVSDIIHFVNWEKQLGDKFSRPVAACTTSTGWRVVTDQAQKVTCPDCLKIINGEKI